MAEHCRQMSDQERADMDLEIRRLRAEEMGYILAGIPLDAFHGERIAQRQDNGSRDPIARFRPRREPNSTFSNATSSDSSFQAFQDSTPSYDSSSVVLAQETKNPCKQFVHMFSEAQDKWHPLAATLDTGTPDNWINEALLKTLSLHAKFEPTDTEYLDFSGKTVKSSAAVDISWCSTERRKVRKNRFRVAQAAPFDVVLGEILIVQEEGILVFNETAWILAKKNPTQAEKEYMAKARARAVEESKLLALTKKIQTAKAPARQNGVGLPVANNNRGG